MAEADPIGRALRHPGRVHFIGIGGVGMAGLARLLMQAGFSVSGSDQQSNRLTRELAKEGAVIHRGHHPDHVRELPDWAVRTPALGEGNPELDALRAGRIPVYVRGQVLAAYSRARHCVAVAGAHGKTTTTSMLAYLLNRLGRDAGYAVGGETSLPGRVADEGKGGPLVLEADESDGTLAHYAPAVGLLTHVEWDHVERFRSEAALLQCYRRFVSRCGEVWIRGEDALALRVCEGHPRVFTVGEAADADLRLLSAVDDPEGQFLKFRIGGADYGFRVPLPGRHNAWNALMAVAAAGRLGIPPGEACGALADFTGVARRFQRVECGGIVLIQDYAHHPTEIRAVMASAAALRPKRLWLVFQPHRFSRTRHLLREFASAFEGADQLGLLPVYAASELPSQGESTEVLAALCRDRFPDMRVFRNHAELIAAWTPKLRPGDVVLIAGAGDVETLQEEMRSALLNG